MRFLRQRQHVVSDQALMDELFGEQYVPIKTEEDLVNLIDGVQSLIRRTEEIDQQIDRMMLGFRMHWYLYQTGRKEE